MEITANIEICQTCPGAPLMRELNRQLGERRQELEVLSGIWQQRDLLQIDVAVVNGMECGMTVACVKTIAAFAFISTIEKKLELLKTGIDATCEEV